MARKNVEIFDCDLKHGDTTTVVHTIPKRGITAREMLLLKAIHGDDAVLNIKPVGHREVDEREELLQLARRYANTHDPLSAKKVIERVFSTSLHDYESWLEQQHELEEMERDERQQKAQEEMRRISEAARAAAEAALQIQGGQAA